MSRVRSLLALLPALLLALAGAAGCATAPAVGSDASPFAADEAPLEVWGDVARLEYSKQVQVRLPARVVVADVTPRAAWERDDESAQRLTTLLDALAPDTVTWSDVGSLADFGGDLTRAGARLEDLRAVAARQQADLLLVVERRETYREGHNAAAFLKLLIVGFFLPTEEDELRLVTRAAVVDARNGLVYATFDDHREAEVTSTVGGERLALRDAFRELWSGSAAELRTSAAAKLAAIPAPSSGTR